MKILIKQGRIIDNNRDEVLDLLIEDGKIKKISKNINVKGAKVIDAKNKIVTPGLIDIHTHLREPGFEYKETIRTGSEAAAFGGFTTIFCMPNTQPCCDNSSVVEFILRKAKEESKVNIYPVGALTKGCEGKELAEIGEMKNAGIIALSDDGRSIQNAAIMRNAMEYAKMFNLPIVAHCEDNNLSEGGLMHEGYYSTIYGLKGVPPEAESIMVARDIQLAELTGCKLHITHVSCKRTVELIREAKKKGLNITCDVTPHHLILTDMCLATYDTNLKVNPPLRSEEDREALIAALLDNTIDAIATDHAPHTQEEKEVEFEYAPAGIIGLETAVGLLFSLINDKKCKIEDIIPKLTINPARIFWLNKGTLSIGSDADVTIIDPNLKWVVDVNKFKSKSKNSPFDKWELKGKVIYTIVNGKIIMSEGCLL